jgi:hypothetical protein
VVVRDAVAGVPREYGELVLENTMRQLAVLTYSSDLVRQWSLASVSVPTRVGSPE